MHRLKYLVVALVPFTVVAMPTDPPQPKPRVVLVVHGGAGALSKDAMTPELEKQYRADLDKALQAGHAVLRRRGGRALDAVEAAVQVLEDAPLFNAGRGAVFTREGQIELSASVMTGQDRKAGAVAGVTRLQNPVSAARAVMEKSPHVLLVGAGAERFCLSAGVKEVNPMYFWTEKRWQQLKDKLDRAKKPTKSSGRKQRGEFEFGTVGAVALDRSGNLAAATSTGGLTGQLAGRVGDSPLIGAGTYADNQTCAVSCTGHGEVFIRHAVAHDLSARMAYKKLSLTAAATEVMRALPKQDGGVGGLIALDRDGNFVLPFDTEGMYRGWITEDGKTHVAIYPE